MSSAPDLIACSNRRREPSTLILVSSRFVRDSARDGRGAVNDGVERTRRESIRLHRKIGLLDPDMLLRLENGRTRAAHERDTSCPLRAIATARCPPTKPPAPEISTRTIRALGCGYPPVTASRRRRWARTMSASLTNRRSTSSARGGSFPGAGIFKRDLIGRWLARCAKTLLQQRATRASASRAILERPQSEDAG